MMTFDRACDFVGLPQTKRQEKKWKNKRGMAFRAALGHISIPSDEIDSGNRNNIARSQLATAGRYDS